MDRWTSIARKKLHTEKLKREKMHAREKVGKSGGSNSRPTKETGAEPAGQMRHEKVHAVVGRSTFGSKQSQKLMASEHFEK